MMVLDPRHLSRPACFDGTQEGSYDEWRFLLVACLAAVDPRFGDVRFLTMWREHQSHTC